MSIVYIGWGGCSHAEGIVFSQNTMQASTDVCTPYSMVSVLHGITFNSHTHTQTHKRIIKQLYFPGHGTSQSPASAAGLVALYSCCMSSSSSANENKSMFS